MQASNLLNYLISEDPKNLPVETSIHQDAYMPPGDTPTSAPSAKAITQLTNVGCTLEKTNLKHGVQLPHYDRLFLSANWLITLTEALFTSY